MLRFAIKTLGCKVNQYDGQTMSAALKAHGWVPADARTPADLMVINTCCVTASAMAKSRNAVRRAVKLRPDAAVFIAGCYSDYDQKQLRKMLLDLGVTEHRSKLAGHHHDLAAVLGSFARRIAKQARQEPAAATTAIRSDGPAESREPANIKARRLAAVKSNVPATRNLPPIERFAGHQRAFVKIQDGCDAFCSYCIVPFTRPRVWSREPEEVLDQCERLVHAGHKEIVLCGVFLGAFGRSSANRRHWPADRGPDKLADLLRRVCRIDGLWRVRLSSLEPGDLSDQLLDVLAGEPKAAPHLHLPLQSGSPKILRRANRQYTADEYRDCIRRVRSALDKPALTTDIIVGLPGETEDDFRMTLDMAREAGFAKIHAFPFSPVEPTAAWVLRHQAPPSKTVKAHLAELAAIEAETAKTYREQFVGQTVEALVEGPSRTGKADGELGQPGRTYQAMTDRYFWVHFDPTEVAATRPRDLVGQVLSLKVTAATATGLAGSLAD